MSDTRTDVCHSLDCTCRHTATQHARKRCNGLDSYQCPCACPSFELSQECAEMLQPEEVTSALAYLAKHGFAVGPNADLIGRYTT